MLDLLVIATAEHHRCDLRQRAVRCAVIEARPDAPLEVLSAADRRLLIRLGTTPALTAVEVADPLALWTLRTQHPRPSPWPGWGTVVDWGVWTGLCLLALAAGLMH